jgi:TPR repeat protein
MLDCGIGESGAEAEVCFERGIMYSSGREDIAINMIEAHKWFNIAALRGHRNAAQLRREVAALMSDSEIGRAQRAARDWLALHPQPSMPAPPLRAAA